MDFSIEKNEQEKECERIAQEISQEIVDKAFKPLHDIIDGYTPFKDAINEKPVNDDFVLAYENGEPYVAWYNPENGQWHEKEDGKQIYPSVWYPIPISVEKPEVTSYETLYDLMRKLSEIEKMFTSVQFPVRVNSRKIKSIEIITEPESILCEITTESDLEQLVNDKTLSMLNEAGWDRDYRPTQSEACRWLREDFGYQTSASHDRDGNWYGFSFNLSGHHERMTYEEAIEEALQAVLGKINS